MAPKSQTARQASIASVDPIWHELRREAEEATRNEPALGSFIFATILSQSGSRMPSATGWRSASIIPTSMPG